MCRDNFKWREENVDLGLAGAIPLAAVTLGAALVQGMLGFGFTLVAISLFLVIVGSDAVQLILLVNLVTTFVLSLTLWRNVPKRLWRYLVAGAFFGFPFGMFVYGAASVSILQIGAGLFVVGFACLAWFDVSLVPANVKSSATSPKMWPLCVGAISGFMATSLGMPGPILILYLSSLDLEKDVVRGTAIAFLAVANIVAVSFHATVFAVESDVMVTALFLLPIAGFGTWCGHLLSRYLGQGSFRHALLILITASGAYTVIHAMMSYTTPS